MASVEYTTRLRTAVQWILVLVVAIGSLAVIYVLFGKMKADARASLLLEIAKVLLQLVVVVILGYFATQVLKSFEANKKADEALHDFRLEFLTRLLSLDESVRSSRHQLRSSGLTYAFRKDAPAIVGAALEAYDTEITSLQQVQGRAIGLTEDINNFPDAFSDAALSNKLGSMVVFLNNLVGEHEAQRPKNENLKWSDVGQLRGFTDSPSSEDYKAWLRAYEGAVFIVRKDLLPTKKAIEARQKSS